MTTSNWKIEWNEQMSVGIPEVDKEHQHFILLVNQLNQAISDRMEIAELKQRLAHILADAKQHFAHEEILLKEWRYPDAGTHANMHTRLMNSLSDLKKKAAPYDLDREWIDAGLKIKEALIGHILKEDMQYADFHRNSLMN